MNLDNIFVKRQKLWLNNPVIKMNTFILIRIWWERNACLRGTNVSPGTHSTPQNQSLMDFLGLKVLLITSFLIIKTFWVYFLVNLKILILEQNAFAPCDR